MNYFGQGARSYGPSFPAAFQEDLYENYVEASPGYGQKRRDTSPYFAAQRDQGRIRELSAQLKTLEVALKAKREELEDRRSSNVILVECLKNGDEEREMDQKTHEVSCLNLESRKEAARNEIEKVKAEAKRVENENELLRASTSRVKFIYRVGDVRYAAFLEGGKTLAEACKTLSISGEISNAAGTRLDKGARVEVVIDSKAEYTVHS